MERFKIVIPSYNCTRWLDKCLRSVESQQFDAFDVCVIDDASTEEGQRDIILKYCKKNQWKYVFNEENLGALANIVHGIRYLSPRDHDVIIPLDGDDWFYDEEVLEKLYEVYCDENHPIYLTYGKEIHYPTGTILPMRELPRFVIEENMFREHPWVFSSPKTFKYLLWKRIADKDLRDTEGNYYRVSWDVSFMLPMLEMAGERIKMMDEILYVYNRENPISDHRKCLKEQKALEKYLRKQEKYSKLL